MQLRIFAVAFIALLFALGQTYGSAASLMGNASAYASSIDQRPASSVQQDDNDEADSDNDEDAADTDNDNNTADADNSDDSADADNSDDDTADADNSDDDDGESATTSTSTGTAAGGPVAPIDSDTLMQPLVQASGTSNGGDLKIAMPGERVAIQIFPWMPSGIQVTIRPVDPNTVMAAPGQRAGDLAFVVEAKDANGMQLSSLPAEVNLAVRYADQTVDGLNESNLTLSRLNTSTNQWQEAPKIVREPDSNYVAASITELGTYVVSAR